MTVITAEWIRGPCLQAVSERLTKRRAMAQSGSNVGSKMVMSIPSGSPDAIAARRIVTSSFQCRPSGIAVVNRRHEGIVERMCTEANPEGIDTGRPQSPKHAFHAGFDASWPQRGQVDDLDRGLLNPLTAVRLGVLRVANVPGPQHRLCAREAAGPPGERERLDRAR